MKNKKGFTLIELLAIIILLGLVALIVVPGIANVVSSSRDRAAEDGALGYIKGIQDYYSASFLHPDFTLVRGADNTVSSINEVLEHSVRFSPTCGFVHITDDPYRRGVITEAQLCIRDRYVLYNEADKATATLERPSTWRATGCTCN